MYRSRVSTGIAYVKCLYLPWKRGQDPENRQADEFESPDGLHKIIVRHPELSTTVGKRRGLHDQPDRKLRVRQTRQNLQSAQSGLSCHSIQCNFEKAVRTRRHIADDPLIGDVLAQGV